MKNKVKVSVRLGWMTVGLLFGFLLAWTVSSSKSRVPSLGRISTAAVREAIPGVAIQDSSKAWVQIPHPGGSRDPLTQELSGKGGTAILVRPEILPFQLEVQRGRR